MGSLALIAGMATMMAVDCNAPVAFSGQANANGDHTAALQQAMQRAANKGGFMVIPPGTYTLKSPKGVRVALKNRSFTINATGATFVSQNVDDDLFNLDTTADSFTSSTCGGSEEIDVTWNGGTLDIRESKVSTSVPQAQLTPAADQGTSSTTDGLSIRGTRKTGNVVKRKAANILIDGLTVIGSNNSYRTAGGDSGLFVSGARSSEVRNSNFFGLRDAGIYLSADSTNEAIGGNYTVRDTTVENSYDGIVSKRGADDITYRDNRLKNNVIGLGIKTQNGRIANNVTMTGNVVEQSERAILIEVAGTVTVSNNRILRLGATVAGQASPVNPQKGRYEGVALEGVVGATISNNDVEGVGGSRETASQTVGIARMPFERSGFTTVATSSVTTNGNSFLRLDQNNVIE